MSSNPFMDYQQKMFSMWKDSVAKIPGAEAYKEAVEKMMPGMEQYWKSAEEAVKDPMEYWKSMTAMLPGLDTYWKTFTGMMPDVTRFENMWPYKIPGMDTYAKVFDMWRGMANPTAFAQDFQEKYLDLMQDLFKGILPEGAAAFMQKPMELMDTSVNFYKQTMSPWMTIDQGILDRIAKGDMNAYTEFFREVNAKYEETFDKYFNMMGMGLNRESNEDVMKAVSAFYKAMFATGELMSLIMKTGTDSMNQLVEKYREAVTEGKVMTTFRDFYDLWYNVTEGELVKMLDTDEFARTFDMFSDKYFQYMSAMNKEYERMLSALPIPTNTDMKSLYKTVYDLRKDVRDLKKELEALKEKKEG